MQYDSNLADNYLHYISLTDNDLAVVVVWNKIWLFHYSFKHFFKTCSVVKSNNYTIYDISGDIYSVQTHRIKIVYLWWEAIPLVLRFFSQVSVLKVESLHYSPNYYSFSIVPLSVSKMANGRWLRMAVILPAHPLGNFFISPAFLWSEKKLLADWLHYLPYEGAL